MNLAAASSIARRELRGGLGAFRIFLACLALGVAAIAAVGTVRSSIEAGLAREGAALLGGDAALEFTYRFASAAELDWMDRVADRRSEVVDFRSMAVVPAADGTGAAGRALTQVKGIDDLYPLVGAVGLDPAIPLAEALADRDGLPGAVMQPILAQRLQLRPGDVFRLGDQDFRLSALLLREPDNVGTGFALGPRTIVRTNALRASGLLAPGTLFETQYRLDLPAGTDLALAEAEAKRRFGDSGLHWRDARDGAPGVSSFVDRMGAFMVLVGLAGLAVGGVGVSAAVRAYLGRKTPVIATLRTLGATRGTIFAAYLIQIGALTLLGVALGLLLGAGLPILFSGLIQARLPVPAVFAVYPAPLAEAALYGLLTALVFALWPLARAAELRAAALFRESTGQSRGRPARGYLALIALLGAVLVGSAVYLSGVTMLALYTAGGILGVLAVLWLAAQAVRLGARRAARLPFARGRPVLRLALGAIGGPSEEAGSVMLSLGLGLAVLASVGQIDANLRGAIVRELPAVAPAYFFVDIQRDQMPEFRRLVESDPAVDRLEAAPMLRGIITRINGRPAREVAGDHWVLRGDRGVTYSARPPGNARITAGSWWPADYDGPPQVSFAAEPAAEMGLKLGDSLTINILGREITAEITSFREVDFSDAGIGFVLSLNPGALAGAPHSFISTVYAPAEAEAGILRRVGDAFPNVTAIRVRDAIDTVSQLLGGLASAISWAAAATLLTGFVVLIGAAAAGERARVYEAAVLKTLGATRPGILTSFALRSVLLGSAAGAVALLAGIGAGWGVSRFVLDIGYRVDWGSALGILAGGVFATMLAGLAFAWRPLAARPARVLRSAE